MPYLSGKPEAVVDMYRIQAQQALTAAAQLASLFPGQQPEGVTPLLYALDNAQLEQRVKRITAECRTFGLYFAQMTSTQLRAWVATHAFYNLFDARVTRLMEQFCKLACQHQEACTAMPQLMATIR
jgi:hypothetical protein